MTDSNITTGGHDRCRGLHFVQSCLLVIQDEKKLIIKDTQIILDTLSTTGSANNK